MYHNVFTRAFYAFKQIIFSWILAIIITKWFSYWGDSSSHLTCQLNPLLIEGGKESTELRLNFDNKYLNKIKHIENGNIRQQKTKVIKNLKILHLNKGSKFLSNSNKLINDLIIREDPDIFTLAECNINFNYD